MDSSIQIPGYRIEVEIGKGGMATVYVAIQESLARRVALKIMASETLADPRAKERFLREGEIVARLNHPNIVTVYDIGRVGTVYYMAMEYIEGGNLNERIKQGLTEENTYAIIRQIAKALAYAHKRGFIHRDVKPANILFKEDDTTVLSDFGIAKAMRSETRLTAIGQTIGTPDYMSPEQVKGGTLDSRSDLYSLGIVIFEMLTGQKPFKGDDALHIAMAHVVAPVPQLPRHLADYQPILNRLLAKDPDERISTAEELIQALDGLVRDRARASGNLAPVFEELTLGTTLGSRAIKSQLRGISWGRVALLVVFGIAMGAAIYYWQTVYRIDPQTRKFIDMLLTQAEQQMQDSNLMEPPGVNAYQYYRNILELDSNNEKALEGLEKIADHFEAQAIGKQQQEQYGAGLALAERGLKAYPHHSGLIALHKELTDQLEEQRRRQKVSELLTQAERQIAQSRLLEPPGDNAYESYRAVLDINPWNKPALTGLWEIADRLEKRAIGKQQQGLFEQGLELTTKGLSIDPQHKGLTSLQKELQQQIEEKQRRQQIARLLTQAKKQLEASRYIKPAGNNAHESYRAVLKLEPHNKEALTGIQKIADHLEKDAIAARQKNQLDESLTLAEQGLQIAPRHSGLLRLRKEVNEQIERMREQRKIASLLAAAERQIQASRWTEPEGDNAYASYREILQLEPGNAQAQAGLERLAEHFEALARKRRDEGALPQGLAAVEQGLQVLPTDAGLQALRAELLGQLEALNHRRREVERLLTEAKRQLAESRVIDPPEDSAYAAYRKVLELEPDNAKAQAGLEKIAKHIEQRALQLRDEGQLTESLAFAGRGLQAFPEHAGLQSLQAELRAKIEELERRRQEVQRLLAVAERQFNASRLTQPAQDNAYASYSKVLELEPGNAEAQAGLARIAARYEQIAREHERKGSLQESFNAVEQGLEVVPEHAALIELRTKLERQMEEQARRRAEQQRRQREIERLLAEAERQLKASQWAEPAGDNAYASYSQVLELEPGNAEAQAGLEKIARHYEELARRRQSEGALEESLAAVERGLEVQPENADLAALRMEVQGQLEQLERRRREVERLLTQAGRQLADSRLLEPPEDNAYASYLKVLELEPGNAGARAGLETIAARFEHDAAQRRDEGLLQQSLALAERGLQAFPGHTGLQSLQAELNAKIEEIEHRRKQVQRLLAEAERQLNASRLTRPAQDNAYASYSKVLELEPDNAEAQAGLVKISALYEQRARELEREGAFEEGLDAVDRGLQVLPEHAALLALREKLESQMEEQALRHAEQQRRQREIQRLLGEAERQIKAAQWIVPEGDNAYASYREILALDPENAQAQQGLETIAGHYTRLARKHRAEGALPQGLAAVEQGLRVLPGDTELQALRSELLGQLEALQRRRREVERLLTEAGRLLAESSIIEPPEDSAYNAYRKVLELDPDNAKAQAGLETIAARIERRAMQLRQEGKFQESLALVERGLQAFSAHAGLQELRTEVRAEIKALERRQREISRLLAEAERQLKASRLMRPAHDNAYASYSKVLELEPHNAEAQVGLEKIAARYEQIAREHERKGSLEESLNAVEQGLQVVPEHAALIELRAKLENQMEAQARRRAEQQRRQGEIKRLLAEAERQLNASQWTEPEGDNAHASYRQVLKLEPGNAQAQAGLEKIAGYYEEQARRRQGEDALEESLAAVERGLEVQPENADLAALRMEVRGQLEEITRRQAEQARHQREIQQLLEQAKQQYADSKLTQPEGANARATYQSVLAMDPGNQSALAGLQAIAEHYDKEARLDEAKDRLNDALVAITAGLKAVPDHPQLLDLKKKVEEQLQEKARKVRLLSEWLDAARNHLASSRYTQPEGNNAYESYKKVLDISPNDPRALAGIRAIADRLLQRGQAEFEKGELNNSLSAIEEGLRVVPLHPGLLALRAKMTPRLEDLQRREELDRLLAQAEQQLAAWKLTRPRGDSAYDTYLKVLEINPQEEPAVAGLQRVADRYIDLGRAKLDQGDLNESLAMIERGLEVKPDHKGLISLRDEVQQRADSLRAQRQELQDLLIEAQQHVNAGRLIQPEGNNAHEAYVMMLEIDAGNREAEIGLRQIAEHYEALAKTRHSAGDLQNALTLVKTGLKADPDYEGLTSLEKEILKQRDDVKQQLEQLLARVQIKLEADQLTRPEGDNAFKIYQKMLNLDPKNPLTIEGLESMKEKCEALVRKKQQQGPIQQCIEFVEDGLRTSPKDSGLLSMKESLTRQLEERRKIEERRKHPRPIGTF